MSTTGRVSNASGNSLSDESVNVMSIQEFLRLLILFSVHICDFFIQSGHIRTDKWKKDRLIKYDKFSRFLFFME